MMYDVQLYLKRVFITIKLTRISATAEFDNKLLTEAMTTSASGFFKLMCQHGIILRSERLAMLNAGSNSTHMPHPGEAMMGSSTRKHA